MEKHKEAGSEAREEKILGGKVTSEKTEAEGGNPKMEMHSHVHHHHHEASVHTHNHGGEAGKGGKEAIIGGEDEAKPVKKSMGEKMYDKKKPVRREMAANEGM